MSSLPKEPGESLYLPATKKDRTRRALRVKAALFSSRPLFFQKLLGVVIEVERCRHLHVGLHDEAVDDGGAAKERNQHDGIHLKVAAPASGDGAHGAAQDETTVSREPPTH